MIQKIQEDRTSGRTVEIIPPIPSNELTLKPNSILVLRCSRAITDMKNYKNCARQ